MHLSLVRLCQSCACRTTAVVAAKRNFRQYGRLQARRHRALASFTPMLLVRTYARQRSAPVELSMDDFSADADASDTDVVPMRWPNRQATARSDFPNSIAPMRQEPRYRDITHSLTPSSDPVLKRGVDDIAVAESFVAMGVEPRLSRALASINIKRPLAIQQATFEPILKKSRVLVEGHTGSGKTLAYLIPLLQQLSLRGFPYNSAVIMVPSRELAVQVYEQAASLLEALGKGSVRLVANGLLLDQADCHDASIIVGTPAALIELYRNDPGLVADLKHIVLDEADKLLDPLPQRQPTKKVLLRQSRPKPCAAFLDHVYFNRPLPEKRGRLEPWDKAEMTQTSDRLVAKRKVQLVCVSATIGRKVQRELYQQQWAVKPNFISAYQPDSCRLPPTLRHFKVKGAVGTSTSSANELNEQVAGMLRACSVSSAYLVVPPDVPLPELTDTLRNDPLFASYEVFPIFASVHVPRGVAAIVDARRSMQATFARAHHDKPVIGLMSWDAVRGLDLPHVDMVVMVATAKNANDYLHIAGRVGRNGRVGHVVTLCLDEKQERRLLRIARMAKFKLQYEQQLVQSAQKLIQAKAIASQSLESQAQHVARLSAPNNW